MPPHPALPPTAPPSARRERHERRGKAALPAADSPPAADERNCRRAQMRNVLSAARAHGFGDDSVPFARSASRSSRKPRLASTGARIIPGAAQAAATNVRAPSSPRGQGANPPPFTPAVAMLAQPAAKASFYSSPGATSKRSPEPLLDEHSPKRPRVSAPSAAETEVDHADDADRITPTPGTSRALNVATNRTKEPKPVHEQDESGSEDDDTVGLGTLIRTGKTPARPSPMNAVRTAHCTPPLMPDSDMTLFPTTSPAAAQPRTNRQSTVPTLSASSSTRRTLPQAPASDASDSDDDLGLGLLARHSAPTQPAPRSREASQNKPLSKPRKTLSTRPHHPVPSPRTPTIDKSDLRNTILPSSSDADLTDDESTEPHTRPAEVNVPPEGHSGHADHSAQASPRRLPSVGRAPAPAPQRLAIVESEDEAGESMSDLSELDPNLDGTENDDDEVMLLNPMCRTSFKSSRVTRVLNPASTLPAKRLQHVLEDLFEDEDSIPAPAELAQIASTSPNTWTTTWLYHIPGTRSRVVLRPMAVTQLTKLVKAASWPFAMRAASDVRDLATLEKLFPLPRQLSDLDVSLLTRLAQILTRNAASDDDDYGSSSSSILSPLGKSVSTAEDSEGHNLEAARVQVRDSAVHSATACAAVECLASVLSAPGASTSLLREDALSSSLTAIKVSITGFLTPLTDAATLATPPTAQASRFFASLARDLAPPASADPLEDQAHVSAIQCASALQRLLSSTRGALRALATLLDTSPLPPSEQVAIAASDLALTAFFLPAADDERTKVYSASKVSPKQKTGGQIKRRTGRSSTLDGLPVASPADLWNAIADPEALSRSRHGQTVAAGGPLALVAQGVLRTLFARVPSQRAWIVDELVTNLLRFPCSAPPGTSFLGRDESGSIQPRPPYALLLHLIQAAARLPRELVRFSLEEEEEEEEKEKGDAGDDEQRLDEQNQLPSTSPQEAETEHLATQEGQSPDISPDGRCAGFGLLGPLSGPRSIATAVVRTLLGRLTTMTDTEDVRGSEALASLVADVGGCLGQVAWPGAGLLLERLASALVTLLHLPPGRAGSPAPGLGSKGSRLPPAARAIAIDVLARLLAAVSGVSSRLAHLPTTREYENSQVKVEEPDRKDVQQEESLLEMDESEEKPHMSRDAGNTHGPDEPLTLQSSVRAVESAVETNVRLTGLLSDASTRSARGEARQFWLAQAWAEMDQLQQAAQAVVHPPTDLSTQELDFEPPTVTPAQREHALQLMKAIETARQALVEAGRLSKANPLPLAKYQSSRALALARAATSLTLSTVRRTPLTTIQSVLVSCLDDRVVGNRTRALRALSTMAEEIWSDPEMKETVLARLSDISPSVRDAALQLVGSKVLAQDRPALSPNQEAEAFETLRAHAPLILTRTQDASLSVRKRALRLCSSVYSALGSPDQDLELAHQLVHGSQDKKMAPQREVESSRTPAASGKQVRDDLRVQLALALVRAMNDDDPIVQQLVLDELQVIWFGITSPSSPAPAAKQANPKSKIKFETKLVGERLIQHARIVTSVCGIVQERPSPLEEVFRRVGRPSIPAGAGLGVRDPATAEALERACRGLVDHLLAALVGVEPAAGKFVDWMSTVHTVVMAHPTALSVSRTKALLPHLRAAQGAAELKVAELIVRILRVRLPSLPRTTRLFAEKLQATLAAAINRVPPGVAPLASMLQELVAAFSTAINTLTHEFHLLVRMTAAAWGRWAGFATVPTDEVDDRARPPFTRATALAVSLTALLVEHTDFDALRKTDPELMRPLDAIVPPDASVRSTLVHQLLRLLPVPSWRLLALRALGFLLRRHAQLWTWPEVAQTIAQALAPPTSTQVEKDAGDTSVLRALAVTGEPDQRSRHLILTTMTEFLALDDQRLEQATTQREREAVQLARSLGRSARAELLGGETEALADSSVSTQVIQQYLEPVLACAINPAAPAIQTLALEVVRHTVMRGLAHPLQCLPTLIGLQTSSDARLATRATSLHTYLSDRHASLLHVRWPGHLKAAFEYHLAEHRVLHTEDASSSQLRGFHLVDGAPRSLLAPWYALIVHKRVARVEFLKALVRLVDVDVSQTVSEERFLLARFAADSLATLPYKSQDEVIQVVHELMAMLTLSGMQTLAVAATYGRQIEKETVPVLARAQPSGQASTPATMTNLRSSSPPRDSSPMRSSTHVPSSPMHNNAKSTSSHGARASPSRGVGRRSLRDRKDVFYGSSSSEEGSDEASEDESEEDEATASVSSTAEKEQLEPSSESDETASDWSDADRAGHASKPRPRTKSRPSVGTFTARTPAHSLGMRTAIPGAEIVALDMDMDQDQDQDPSETTPHVRVDMTSHARATMAMSMALGLRMHLRWLYRVTDAQLERYAELLAAGTRRRGRVPEASNRQAHMRSLDDPLHMALDLDTPLAAVQTAVRDALAQFQATAGEPDGGLPPPPLTPTADAVQVSTDLHVMRLYQELIAADGPLDQDEEEVLSDADDD